MECCIMLLRMDTWVSNPVRSRPVKESIDGVLTPLPLLTPLPYAATLILLLPSASLPLLLHQNASGNTPLHWAGLNGHLPVVKALVGRIDELERQRPDEARRINVLKHEEEARLREKRRQALRREQMVKAQTGQGEDASTITATAAAPQAGQEQQEEEADLEPEPERSLWDIRNRFGRGPTSEAQMNEREEVVQFLLGHMVTGGAAGAAAAAEGEGEGVARGQGEGEGQAVRTGVQGDAAKEEEEQGELSTQTERLTLSASAGAEQKEASS